MKRNKIKNKNYRQFLDKGEITLIKPEQIDQALKNIKGSNYKEGRSLLIALYYTGGRPNEVLDTNTEHINKEGSYLKYFLKGSKGGLSRTIYLPLRIPHIKELWKYRNAMPPNYQLFHHFKSKYTRTKVNKKGEIITLSETTAKLRYHLNKWFTGVIEDSITPYFLRHNRFSQLSEAGAALQDIRMLKGSKTTESVTPYLHLSSKISKNIARKIK